MDLMWSLNVCGHLVGTLTLEWYLAMLVVKNGHRINTHNYNIRLCAHNIITILGLIITQLGWSQCHHLVLKITSL